MALKKPNEVLGRRNAPHEQTIAMHNLKDQIGRLKDLKGQFESFTTSIDDSLTEVVDLEFLAIKDDLDGFNNKIDRINEDLSDKVNRLKKTLINLNTDFTIVEKRLNSLKLVEGGKIEQLKREVLTGVQESYLNNVAGNIKRLEEKVETIGNSHKQVLKEEFLNDPPSTKNRDPLTPFNQKFSDLDDFQQHYRLFINRIQRQISTLGGGGAVLITDLDDVDNATAKTEGSYLRYDSSIGKWKGSTAAGETNQNAFSNVAVSGQDTIAADTKTDTLTVVGGANVTVTTTAASDTLTIASTDTQLSTEAVQDIVGGMFTGNTETNIAATYQDDDGTIDLVVTPAEAVVDTDSWTASQGTAQVIQSYAIGAYHCVEYTIHVTYGAKLQTQKLLVMDNGSAVHHNQYAVMYTDEKLLDFSAAINSGNIEVKATPPTGVNGATITVRTIKQVI